MKAALPNIYDYISFRKYLEDYRTARSSYDSHFTHYYICHRLGMKNSRSYFNNIVRGRKNISPETAGKLIDLIELSHEEANYFRALVNYDQAREPGDKKYYLDQIVKLNNTPHKIIDEETLRYFTVWYNPIVRELLDTFDFDGDYKKLAQKVDPPITTKQAKESIALLQKLDLIEKNERGYLKPNGKVVITPDHIQSQLVEQYQVLSLGRACDRIVNDKNGHVTTTMTVAVSRGVLEHILEHINELRSTVRSLAHKDEQADKKVYEVILHVHKQSK
jgi:uncharacterized protein (TIGR02147 family)